MTAPSSVAERRRATAVCTLCIATYLASYLIRKLLSIYNPQIVAAGEFTATETAALASLYMLVYAAGQLVCGLVGDVLHPKYMVASGLCLAGAASIAFSVCCSPALAYVLFGLIGLGMSMLRGPIVRIIAQSCNEAHARLGNVLLSFVSFVAPFIVGFMALFIRYRMAYGVIGGVCLLAAVIFYIAADRLHKRGILRLEETQASRKRISLREFWQLDRLPVFLLLSIAVEITSSSVEHWLTLYMTDALRLDAGTAGMIFSVISLVRALSTVLCLPMYALFRRNEGWMLFASFALAALCFLLMWLSPYPVLSLVLLFVAQIACGVASAVVWSIYLPSLASSGRVSGVNGVLDAAGYASSAGTTVVFASVVTYFSYDGLVLTWCLVCTAAFLISLLATRKKTSTAGAI